MRGLFGYCVFLLRMCALRACCLFLCGAMRMCSCAMRIARCAFLFVVVFSLVVMVSAGCVSRWWLRLACWLRVVCVVCCMSLCVLCCVCVDLCCLVCVFLACVDHCVLRTAL